MSFIGAGDAKCCSYFDMDNYKTKYALSVQSSIYSNGIDNVYP